MKNISKKTKLLIVILAVIIVAGIITIVTAGFNFELKYQQRQKIELYLNTEFEISDIKQITDEVMGNQQVIIQKVEVYEDSVSIIAKEITDEQKEQIVTKINEKYSTELTAEGTTVTNIPSIKGIDIVKPYITAFVISIIIILIYMAIRFNKLGAVKTVITTLGILILTQLTLFSIIAITRIPIGRFTMAIVIAVYMISLFVSNSKFENNLKEKIENDKQIKK